MVKNLVII